MAKERTGTCRWRHGAWRLQVSDGTDPATGKRLYQKASVYAPNTAAGERKAKAELAKLVLRVTAGEFERKAERGTFKEMAEKYIRANCHDWTDPEKAARETRGHLERHVYPTLGAMQVADIRRADVMDLYAELRERLKGSSIRRLHSVVHAVLEYALEREAIDYNPAHGVAKKSIKVRKPSPRRLPDAGLVRVAMDASPDWFKVFIRLAAHTGSRPLELCRLRWDDVDLDAGKVRVDQPKQDNDKEVVLGPATTAVLGDWRKRCVESALRTGTAPEWVFPSPRKLGAPIGRSAVSHTWDRVRKACPALAGYHLYSLRGQMATQLLSTGTDVKTAQARGGWSNPQVFITTYAQVVDDKAVAAATALDVWLDEG